MGNGGWKTRVYLEESNVTFSTNNFFSNSADNLGGAMYLGPNCLPIFFLIIIFITILQTNGEGRYL